MIWANDVAENPRLRYRLSVSQYHEMIARGVIEEGAPFELLDGQIVRKLRNAAGEDEVTVGNAHALVVKRLARLGQAFESRGCHLQTQQPVTVSDNNEPEPDAAIVIGSEENYAERHPAASDILCVVEGADASLSRDRGYKQRIYADAGIPHYLIINLPDRVIEVYTEPLPGKGRYGQSITLQARQSVTLPVRKGKPVAISVSKLLP